MGPAPICAMHGKEQTWTATIVGIDPFGRRFDCGLTAGCPRCAAPEHIDLPLQDWRIDAIAIGGPSWDRYVEMAREAGAPAPTRAAWDRVRALHADAVEDSAELADLREQARAMWIRLFDAGVYQQSDPEYRDLCARIDALHETRQRSWRSVPADYAE